MKHTLILVLITIAFYSCNPEKKANYVESADLEMEVINAILPQLIPEHPPCMVAPIEGESNEEYDKRLQAFYDEVDSVGKKIEIVGVLTKLDSNYIEIYKRSKDSPVVQQLLNAPNSDKTIDSTMIDKINNIRVLIVKTPHRLTDCYTLGQFNISRVGFNSDSTRAAFTYFIDDGSCTGGEGGIIDAELKDGKWQKIQ